MRLRPRVVRATKPAATEIKTNIITARPSSSAGPTTLSSVRNSEIGWATFAAANQMAWLKRSDTSAWWQCNFQVNNNG